MSSDEEFKSEKINTYEENYEEILEEEEENKDSNFDDLEKEISKNIQETDSENQEENITQEKLLQEFDPLIPDIVLNHILELNGIDCADIETKKTIAAMAQKFISDVAISSFQFHKIHQKSALKDKRFPKEKKITLNVEDLQKALEEYGIDISRPSYFI